MDVNVRHWDSTERKVKTCYFDSQFHERLNADNLLDSINVSAAVGTFWISLTRNYSRDGFSKTLNIGSCAQHVHGAFQTGSSNTGWNLERFTSSKTNLKTISGTDIFSLW